MKKIILCFSAFCLFAFSMNSCKKDPDNKPAPVDPTDSLRVDSIRTVVKKAAVANYANIVYASYSDALTKAQALKTSIDAFVAAPSASTLDGAKQAWKDARIPYGQTEVYRFYDGPIDNATDGPEGLLNAWPMDEAFIDYVQGNATSGLINDLTFTISKTTIEAKNENGGETNISCGYHAIEFLLWGQDLSASGPGARPYTDYSTSLTASRRGQYLKICAELLVEHLQTLVDAWSPSGSGNYRQTFITDSVNKSLTSIIQGMGFLSKGELAGERIEVAYDSQLSEDEHSCFSDNTHIDIRMNAQGIKNVYLGSYTRTDGTVISGTGIFDVVQTVDSIGAEDLKNKVTASMNACNAIQAPFDQQIIAGNPGGRLNVKEAIDRLKEQGDKIAVAASKLHLSIVIE